MSLHEVEITEFDWCGITIEVMYTRNWLNGFANHIEVRAGEPLSITATGYKSHFMSSDSDVGMEEVLKFLVAWLDDAALSKSWQEAVDKKRQGELFDL